MRADGGAGRGNMTGRCLSERAKKYSWKTMLLAPWAGLSRAVRAYAEGSATPDARRPAPHARKTSYESTFHACRPRNRRAHRRPAAVRDHRWISAVTAVTVAGPTGTFFGGNWARVRRGLWRANETLRKAEAENLECCPFWTKLPGFGAPGIGAK